jgi:site-specific recombinase XerC
MLGRRFPPPSCLDNLETVQKILGHSVITTTERYAHLAPEFMASEADRLSLA